MATEGVMVNPKAVSVAERIKMAAKSTKQDTQNLLIRFALERLLARASTSRWAQGLHLKGGMLMLALSQDGSRPTEDLDLMLEMDPEDASAFVAELCAVIPEQDDGLRFDPATIEASQIRDGCLPGARVKLFAYLDAGKRPTEIRVKLDLAWGDALCVGDTVEMPTVLNGFERVRVRSIPVSSIVADKLHAIHRHGMLNTRMKDYYDLLVVFRSLRPDPAEVADAVRAVFKVWGGEPSEDIPGLSDDFAEEKEKDWRAFVRGKNGLKMEVGTLVEVVTEIRACALPILRLATAEAPEQSPAQAPAPSP